MLWIFNFNQPFNIELICGNTTTINHSASNYFMVIQLQSTIQPLIMLWIFNFNQPFNIELISGNTTTINHSTSNYFMVIQL